jgi:murein DD-endopeptidase MepM/ murein hydrolase activator NlpD
MQLPVWKFQMLKKTVLIFYLIFVHALAGLFVYESCVKPYFHQNDLSTETILSPTESSPVPTPQTIPSIEITTPTPELAEVETNANQTSNAVNQISNTVSNATAQTQNNIPTESAQTLMIPVVGIKREQLQDTYNDARSEGRVHNAIDIIAKGGTPVVAASDGEIAKFFDSVKGGTTIYQYSPDKHFIYYYAHLQKRADNIKEHDFVKQGTIIGYVGDTGNAGAGNFHLHFEIMTLKDPKRYFDGTDINPFPILKNGIEAK